MKSVNAKNKSHANGIIVGKKTICNVCGEHIDRSDAQETFGSVSRKGWYMNDKYISSVRYQLCGNCILDVTAHIREMQILHRPAIEEAKA